MELWGGSMTKRFDNRTNNKSIAEAIKIAESLLTPGSSMLYDISVKNDWQYGIISGTQAAIQLAQVRPLVPVFTYRKRFSRAVGYFQNDEIYINLAKMHLHTQNDLVALLVHEAAHYAGFHHVDEGFWGKRFANKRTQNKINFSLPYWLSTQISEGRWINK